MKPSLTLFMLCSYKQIMHNITQRSFQVGRTNVHAVVAKSDSIYTIFIFHAPSSLI